MLRFTRFAFSSSSSSSRTAASSSSASSTIAARLTPKTDRRKILKKFKLSVDDVSFVNKLAIVGCDETGTGCLAGNLVAAAFCSMPFNTNNGNNNNSSQEEEEEELIESESFENEVWDSKAITANARKRIFEELKQAEEEEEESQLENGNDGNNNEKKKKKKNRLVVSSVQIASPELIDAYNVTRVRLNYLSLAVRSVVDKVKQKVPDALFCVVVDGQEMPEDLPVDFPMCLAIPQADSKYFSVAAASVIAKVIRDKQMDEFDKEFPGWDFSLHRGYGTAAHINKCLENPELTPIHRKSFTQNLKPHPPSKTKEKKEKENQEKKVDAVNEKNDSKSEPKESRKKKKKA